MGRARIVFEGETPDMFVELNITTKPSEDGKTEFAMDVTKSEALEKLGDENIKRVGEHIFVAFADYFTDTLKSNAETNRKGVS